MQHALKQSFDIVDNCELVHGLLEQCLAREQVAMPRLPDMARCLLPMMAEDATRAEQLADVISAMMWRSKLLDIPGQQRKAKNLWRHALATAQWSRHVSRLLGREAETGYLCGMLHNIGKVVTLAAVQVLAQRSYVRLSGEECDRLIETFHRHIGMQVGALWQMPAVVQSVITQWEAYGSAGSARVECNIVNLAHQLSDYTLMDSTLLARDLIIVDSVYTDLGFSKRDGAALFDLSPSIDASLERYPVD